MSRWCSNTAHWQYERCNITVGNGEIPYDPQYNLQYLSAEFPYDVPSSTLAWISVAAVASACILEVYIRLVIRTNSCFSDMYVPLQTVCHILAFIALRDARSLSLGKRYRTTVKVCGLSSW